MRDDGRAAADADSHAKAQKTWFFGVYADRTLAEHVRVTSGNASAMWHISERLIHAGQGPSNLWPGLAARCELGGGVQAKELAARFEKMFPDAYLEFTELTPPAEFAACMR
jgi:hypothetical protein